MSCTSYVELLFSCNTQYATNTEYSYETFPLTLCSLFTQDLIWFMRENNGEVYTKCTKKKTQRDTNRKKMYNRIKKK